MNNILNEKSNVEKFPFVLKVGFCIMFVLFLFSLLCITYKKEYKLKYDENSTLNYKVYLKDNEFYTEKYLGMDNAYIASLVDYIDVNMNYNFSTKDDIKLNYDYKILATVNVKNRNGKNIFKKDDVLFDSEKINVSEDNLFNITENVKISYDKYNSLAQQFIERYKLSGVEAVLDVKLLVNVGGESFVYDKNASNKSAILLSIPLASDTTEFTINYNLSNESDVILQHSEALITNKLLLVLIIILAICDLIGMALTILIIVKRRNAQAKYEVELKRIKKTYSDYMCETNLTQKLEDMEKTTSMKVISVKNFNGLVDAADKINKPILFHEENNESSVFYIYDEKVCYIYNMSVKDFEK